MRPDRHHIVVHCEDLQKRVLDGRWDCIVEGTQVWAGKDGSSTDPEKHKAGG